jgi:hypothetical protein
MTRMLRWVALAPVALRSFVAVLMLLGSLRGLLLRFCPAGSLDSEWTTDLSRPGHEVGGLTCSAAWFPGAEMALLVFAFSAAVAAAGCVAAWVGPTRKLACGLSSAALVILYVYLLSRFS